MPVVATAVGGIPELAPPGTPSSSRRATRRRWRRRSRRLLADPDAARAQAERALAHVREHLSAGGDGRAVEAVYERALERRA